MMPAFEGESQLFGPELEGLVDSAIVSGCLRLDGEKAGVAAAD